MRPPGGAAFAVLFLLLAGPGVGRAPQLLRRDPPTTSAPNGEVVVSPEFIQGAIPGAEVVLLVSQDDETAGMAMVTASASGAEVSVRPSQISGTDVAEVPVVPDATAAETELTVTIEVATHDTSRTVTRTVSVLPWDDDRVEQAGEILGVFTSWLAENRRERVPNHLVRAF